MKLIDILVEELPKRGGWDEKWHQCAQDGNGEVCFFTSSEINFRRSFDTWSIPSHGAARHDGKARIEALLADDYAETIITREQYEAALAAKNDGWIEWGGGECPLHHGAIIDAKDRDGYIHHGGVVGESYCIDDIFWRRGVCVLEDNEIIAYRLHHPQEVAQTEAEQEAYLNDCIGQTPATVWNGDGLPPVGCECEFISNDTSWGSVIVIGLDGDKVVIKPSGETYYGITPSEKQFFLPIRSEAERKREWAAQALCDAGGGNGKVEEKAGYGSCWFGVYDAIATGKIPGVKLED